MSITSPTGGAFAPARPDLFRSIGGWQLVQPLSENGRCRVCRARPAGCPPDWPADYVVKLLEDRHAADPNNLCWLRREAIVGRAASDAHLAPVLAAHVEGPPYYLVRPYLEGETLDRQLHADVPRAATVSLWIARQVAEALAELHRHGWLHSDVKPANIVLSPQGHATLIDLGFSRRVGESSGSTAFLGTLAYAAPENFCRARPLGGSADVYSLGAALYELLAGRPPFVTADLAELAAAHLSRMPQDIRSILPQLPGGVSKLLARMLAKDPLRRPDAAELVERLIDLEIETFDDRLLAA